MQVLIIEAEDDFRLLLARRLGAKGFDVAASDDLDEALDLACKESPKIVLLGMTGFGNRALGFLEDVALVCPEARVMIINPGDMSLSIAAMKHGAVDEVTVPVDMAELVAKLRAIRAPRRP